MASTKCRFGWQPERIIEPLPGLLAVAITEADETAVAHWGNELLARN